MTFKKYSCAIDGKTFEVELNNWAEQASGSVLARLGDTMVLATAVMSQHLREGGDFFPLTVDYEEKFYAAGKILGSRFVKRETRPSEEAILVMRMIDRAIRPRFDPRMRNEVQVVVTTLSIDDENDPDVPALLAASLALSLSDIPWNGPVAACRVGLARRTVALGRQNSAFISNPSKTQQQNSDCDVMVAGTQDRINMMEAGANEISEDDFAAAVEFGFSAVKELIDFQKKIISENSREKTAVALIELPVELQELINQEFSEKIASAMYHKTKKERVGATNAARSEWHQRAYELYPERYHKAAAEHIFEEKIDEIIHQRIIQKGERPDGRKIDELRPISASVGVLPRVHGSGLFMRGETHALSTLTLGAPGDEQIIEGMEVRAKRRFLHHYNFPPYSTGEIKQMRGPGRREIGHGALAGKAIEPILPSKEDFPYTIRIVSEILSSNGSTSMAAVCGSSLALMDAGVPIKKAVAGAAMGLMIDNQGNYRVITDLQGQEDLHGDMDFKVAGTRDGITAVQLDVKIEGLNIPMIKDALKQALSARMQILSAMDVVISAPRPELSPYAPRVITMKINPEKIGAVIGPGGKIINAIIAQTGADIDIDDAGAIFITAENESAAREAMEKIKAITRELKAGEILQGRVERIMEFGAIVELTPNADGMVHISELAPYRVQAVEDIVQVGDVIPVKIKEIRPDGKISLSLKEAKRELEQNK
jgi:polyribonucleotide nucleotidyltransferase